MPISAFMDAEVSTSRAVEWPEGWFVPLRSSDGTEMMVGIAKVQC